MTIACAAFFVLGHAARGADDGPQATAIAYERGPFVRNFAVRGVLSLDRIASNQSWYCDYLSLVAAREAQADQPFVQAGLIRWSRNHFRLSAFVVRSDRQNLGFDDLGVLSDGPHDIALRASDGRVHVLIDGHERRIIALSQIFTNRDSLYVQFVGAVSRYGDDIRAMFEHVQVRHEGERTLRAYNGGCRYYDRGLRMETHGDNLTATGRFAAGEPSRYADCDQFFGRRS